MGLIESGRELLALAQEAKNAAMTAATARLNLELAEVMSQKADLIQENTRLRAELEALKQQLAQREALTFEDNMYWQKREDGSREGPFCPSCQDFKHMLVRMQELLPNHPGNFRCHPCHYHAELSAPRRPWG